MRFRIRSVARWTVPLGVAVLLTLVSGSGAPARAEEPGAGGPAEEQVAPPVRASSRDVPKLESALQRLAGLNRQDTQLVPQFAEASDLTVRNGEVVVVVQASPDRLPYVVDQVSLLGGRVLRSQGELAKVSLPIDTLESLARLADVEFVRRPYTGIAAEVVSEGVTRVGADSWQLGGFLGDGVKVAIVDLGFEGYASLLGTELPGSVVTRSFRIDGDIEVGNTHGVRVAEVVHDMAPNCRPSAIMGHI